MRTQNTLGPAPDQPHFASRMGQVQRPPHFCASELIRTSRTPSGPLKTRMGSIAVTENLSGPISLIKRHIFASWRNVYRIWDGADVVGIALNTTLGAGVRYCAGLATRTAAVLSVEALSPEFPAEKSTVEREADEDQDNWRGHQHRCFPPASPDLWVGLFSWQPIPVMTPCEIFRRTSGPSRGGPADSAT